jgi:hypothetical protein
MTFREVSLIISGYADRVVNQYRQTRLLMFMMAKMWGDPKKSPKTPEDLWQLPGDEAKGQMNEDEIAAIFEKLKMEQDGRNA